MEASAATAAKRTAAAVLPALQTRAGRMAFCASAAVGAPRSATALLLSARTRSVSCKALRRSEGSLQVAAPFKRGDVLFMQSHWLAPWVSKCRLRKDADEKGLAPIHHVRKGQAG